MPSSTLTLIQFASLVAAASVIRSRSIDVLIDLNGQTLGSGLPILAYRPSPIQVTYLGLPQTTSLSYIDYLISDASVTPPDIPNKFTESLAFTSHPSYIVNDYKNLQGHTRWRHPLRPPPEGSSGDLFVGVLSNMQKVNPKTFDALANVLRRLGPGAKAVFFKVRACGSRRMSLVISNSLLHSSQYKGYEQSRPHVQSELASRGIRPARILWANLDPWISHTWGKSGLDFVLDTPLKNGHTTGLDAAWALLPSVTFAGESMGSRAGQAWGEAVEGWKSYEDVGVFVGSDGALRYSLREALLERISHKSGDVFDSSAGGARLLHAVESLVSSSGMHVYGSLDLSLPPSSELMSGASSLNISWQGLRITPPPVKLHIGGLIQSTDWVTSGTLMHSLPYPNCSVSEIYASHVLEHAPYSPSLANSVEVTLSEWFRALTPGGRVKISVPDLHVLSSIYVDPRTSASGRFAVMRMMFGGQVDEMDYHYVGFDEEILKSFLEGAGFCQVERVDSLGVFSDTSEARWDWEREEAGLWQGGISISLNVIAVKC